MSRTNFQIVVFCASAAFPQLLPAGTTTLSFDERVRAQTAVERVYYSHQDGAKSQFETAVQRTAIEAKVRDYLAKSAALDRYWATPVTDEMLQSEIDRMVRGSKMPSRLRELFAALGDDPTLIKECLARPALVARLARSRYAFDAERHADTRSAADELYRRLLSGSVSTSSEQPNRVRVTLVRSEVQEDRNQSEPTQRGRALLSAEEFRKTRSRFPRSVGAISPMSEDEDAFRIRAVLSEQDGQAEVVVYTIPKLGWDAWWKTARDSQDWRGVPVVAQRRNSREFNRAADRLDRSARVQTDGWATQAAADASSCLPEDEWRDGSLGLRIPSGGYSSVWTGTTLIIWGGNTGVIGGETVNTGFRYDPSTDAWSSVSTVGAPTPRAGHSAVWTSSLMIVWGGYASDIVGGTVRFASGGRYNPTDDSWTPTNLAGAPAARSGHTAVWSGNRMVVWGGGAGVNFDPLATGGVYNPITNVWSATSLTNAPTARINHTAVLAGSRMIVWGGCADNGCATYLDTGGRFDPIANTWAPTQTIGAPLPRAFHTAVSTGPLMIVWGGAYPSGGIYDPALNSWSPTSEVNAPTNFAASSVWTGSKMLVYGFGTAGGSSYDPGTDAWTPLTNVGAPIVYFPSAVWTGTEMIVFGLPDSTYGSSSPGGRFNPRTNSWLPLPTGTYPFLSGQSSVWTGTLAIVWGGDIFAPPFPTAGTGARFDPATDTWSPVSLDGAPSARPNPHAIWTGSRMVIWGGGNGMAVELPVGGGRYDPIVDRWSPVSLIGTYPSGHLGETAVWTGTEIIFWGGAYDDFGGPTDEGRRYNPVTDTWRYVTRHGAPFRRRNHSAVWTGHEMIVWGGETLSSSLSWQTLDTGARYDPNTDVWTHISAIEAPEARMRHSAIWTGSEMVIWGGTAWDIAMYRPLDTGGRYSPASDSWSPTSLAGAPPPRAGHAAFWTGHRMLVWGGTDPNDPGQQTMITGGRYDPAADTWAPTSVPTVPVGSLSYTDSLWTGRELFVFGVSDFVFPATSLFQRYSFGDTTDDDGDGVSECGGDCDDSRASVNPSASESPGPLGSCADGLDNDCDGLVDTADPSCAGAERVRLVDFGPGSIPPAPGYVRDDGSPFSAVRGFGWLIGSGRVPARSRSCTDVPELAKRTFVVSSAAAVWEVELPNGEYDVSLSVGDCSFSQGPQRVEVEGLRLVADETSPTHDFLVRGRRVRLMDGRLTVAIGGTTGNTVLNYLNVVPAAVQPTTLRSINFQPENAEIPDGFEPDFGDPFVAAAGRGWSRSLIAAVRSRGKNADLALDSLVFVGSPSANYDVVVPNGTYDVKLAVGDAQFAQGPQRVIVEGATVFNGESTAVNQFLTGTTRLNVSDGRLTVQVGGTTGLTTLNYLTIATAQTTDLKVNFQPRLSPIPAGFQADWGARFDGNRGFGWQSNLEAATRDRNKTSNQSLDTLLTVASVAQVWELELPWGNYRVTVAVGDSDPAYSHIHKVVVEGTTIFNGLPTSGGGSATQSVTVPIHDGKLTMTVGGLATSNTTINYVEILSVD